MHSLSLILLLAHVLKVCFGAATSTGVTSTSTPVVVGYFPNWLYAKYPVTQIPYGKYTHLNYAFAILSDPTSPVSGNSGTAAEGYPQWADPYEVQTQLPQLVSLAHNSSSKVLISVGGWSGCIQFSPVVADKTKRQNFINWNIDAIKQYNTDGVDIDWEYPGRQGAGCNVISKDDTTNFLTLLQELRQALDKNFSDHKELTLAVHVRPFLTAAGTYMTDVSGFAKVVDRVNIMSYDINGGWNTTSGPNAPFNYQPGYGDADSVVSSVEWWMRSKMPANQITIGLAFYGRSTTASENMVASITSGSKTAMYQAQSTVIPLGDNEDGYWQDPYCSKDPGGNTGIWKYKRLLDQNVLSSPTAAGQGWVRTWDAVSQTPWLFNPSTKTFISYDDPKSLAVKVNYAKCMKLAGVMVWSIDEDSPDNQLLDVAVKVKSGGSTGTCSSVSMASPSIAKRFLKGNNPAGSMITYGQLQNLANLFYPKQ